MVNATTAITLLMAASAIIFLAVNNKQVNDRALLEKEQVERAVSDKNDELDECQESLRNGNADNMKYTKDKASLNDKIKEMDSKIGPLRQFNQQTVDDLSNQITSLQNELNEVNKQIESFGSIMIATTTLADSVA